MRLIDTHSHIYDAAFDGDRSDVLQRALDSGVGKILLPAIDSESHEALFKLANDYAGLCIPMMGLHPTSVNGNVDYLKELELVDKYLANPPVERFCAVGEVGLDLYWEKAFYREQREAFEFQIELSLRHDLPLVIHTREAWDGMLDVLKAYRAKGVRGVMHAFSGTWEDYVAVKDSGDFMFGIGGVITYKKSGLADLVARMALADIVLESDAPYLPPVPFRGKRNESSYVSIVAEAVARIMKIPVEEVGEITTRNAERMFKI